MPVVVTEVDDPGPLVQPLLPALGSSKVVLGLLAADSVDGHEVLEQPGSLGFVMDKQDMLGVVAVLAQAEEAAQPLVADLFVVLPDLVTAETSLPATYLAAVASRSIGGPADTVPLRRWQQFCQAG
jgi:hypothetical protein